MANERFWASVDRTGAALDKAPLKWVWWVVVLFLVLMLAIASFIPESDSSTSARLIDYDVKRSYPMTESFDVDLLRVPGRPYMREGETFRFEDTNHPGTYTYWEVTRIGLSPFKPKGKTVILEREYLS